MKGRTRWYPRNIHPFRNGHYECAVRISRSLPLIPWMLEWDGVGFVVPCPMEVHMWRGMTKKAYHQTILDMQTQKEL